MVGKIMKIIKDRINAKFKIVVISMEEVWERTGRRLNRDGLVVVGSQVLWLLCVGLHPTNLQACSCPVVRLKKEPGGRDRDVSGLLDRKSYSLWRKSSGATPHCVQQTASRTGQQSLPPEEGGGRRGLPAIGGSRLISYQGNQWLWQRAST